MGMETAGWPKETPPTKITASMPKVKVRIPFILRNGKGGKPSRRTVIKGRMKRTHFPVRVFPSTPMKDRLVGWSNATEGCTYVCLRKHIEVWPSTWLWLKTKRKGGVGQKWGKNSLISIKFTSIHFEHSDTHDKDHDGGDELENA